MSHRTRLVLYCLTLLFSAGCGPRVPQNPLARVGGTRLVYKPQDSRPLEPDRIASALNTILQTDKSDSVYAREQDGNCEILLPSAGKERVAKVKDAIAKSNRLQFRIIAEKPFDAKLIAAAEDGQDPQGARWLLFDPKKIELPPQAAVRKLPNGKSVALVVEGNEPVDAWHLEYAAVSRDESNRPSVMGTLNPEGAARMEKLTSQNDKRQLAIIVDEKIASAPMIQSTITSHLMITGDFPSGELESLVVSIRIAHALGSLEPQPRSETQVPKTDD